MGDSHVKDIGQVQPGEKPAKDEIDSADQQADPRSQMSRSEIHAGQRIEQNDQIAVEVVDFHEEWVSARGYSSRNSTGFQITDKEVALASVEILISLSCPPRAAGARAPPSSIPSRVQIRLSYPYPHSAVDGIGDRRERNCPI